MTKARDSIEDLKTIDANLAAKAPLASPVFTGNVGVGVTPANNATPASGVQVGATASIGAWESGSNIITTVASNSYYNSAYKYITTNTAALIRLINGAINFNVAPSGSANAAISWTTAMNINAAGIVTKPLQPVISVSRDNNGLTMSTNEDLFASTSMLNWVVQGITHNTSNGRFTVPVAGKYYIHFYSMKKDGVVAYFQVRKNGADTLGLRIYETSAQAGSIWHSYGLGGVFTLAANDYINVVCASGGTEVAHGQKHMNFTIQLVG